MKTLKSIISLAAAIGVISCVCINAAEEKNGNIMRVKLEKNFVQNICTKKKLPARGNILWKTKTEELPPLSPDNVERVKRSILPETFYEGVESVHIKGGSGGPGMKTRIINSKEEISYSTDNVERVKRSILPETFYEGVESVHVKGGSGGPGMKTRIINSKEEISYSTDNVERVKRSVLPDTFYEGVESVHIKGGSGGPGMKTRIINSKEEISYSTDSIERVKKSVLPETFYNAINGMGRKGGSNGPGFKTVKLNSREEFSYSVGNGKDTATICYNGNVKVDCSQQQTEQDSDHELKLGNKKPRYPKEKTREYSSVLPNSFYNAITGIGKNGGSNGPGFKTVKLNSREEFSYSVGNGKDTATICYKGNVKVDCFPQQTEQDSEDHALKLVNKKHRYPKEKSEEDPSVLPSGFYKGINRFKKKSDVLPNSFYKSINRIKETSDVLPNNFYKGINRIEEKSDVLTNSFYKGIDSVKKKGGSGGPGFKTLILSSREEFSYSIGNGEDPPFICYIGNVRVNCFPETVEQGPKSNEIKTDEDGSYFQEKSKGGSGEAQVLPISFYEGINNIKKADVSSKVRELTSVLPSSYYNSINKANVKGFDGPGFKTVITGNGKGTIMCYDGKIQVDCFPKKTEHSGKRNRIKIDKRRKGNYFHKKSGGHIFSKPENWYVISSVEQPNLRSRSRNIECLDSHGSVNIGCLLFKPSLSNSGEENDGSSEGSIGNVHDHKRTRKEKSLSSKPQKHYLHETGLGNNEGRSTSKGSIKTRFDLKRKKKARRCKHKRRKVLKQNP